MFEFFRGVRVLDLSLFFPGNLAGEYLADLGADVIKVERPPKGDNVRYVSPNIHGYSSLHVMVNRNKRSVCLNLRDPDGKDVFLRLAQTADALIEAFVPGTMRNLGLDYEAVSAVNPRIVYCSLSAYGQNGPAATWPAHSMDGMAGSMPLEDRGDGTPRVAEGWTPYAHDNGGTYAAIATMAALYHAKQTGKGCYLDVSTWESEMARNYRHFMNIMNGLTYWQWGRFGPRLEVYLAKDDKPIIIGPIEKWFWKKFCYCIGREDWIERGPRRPDDFLDKDEPLRLDIQAVLKTKTRDEWLQIFGEADVPASPVLQREEVLELEQFKARRPVADMVLRNGKVVKQIAFPLKVAGMEYEARSPAELGEHSRSVLKEAGISDQEIARLEEKRVLQTYAPGGNGA